ncbi:MAG: type II 3-dehydroquinate dehydratase [Clostridiales bacterium]|uniref:type II 3-dehydroquinate dehydratase n=1 Tax=Clostridium sp. N3C TaxID=1776758 RepID=UPI00092DF545|nr:type II 3-dehydroquinate dehydratase [Clostridium sp. N3C]NLZ49976.1 type II 3-dehydroquinate dehydratase [Clostridiales bacterium]SCN22374.1 3-dehydroquinate dehydratase [Clostridium sp. N3C]
MKILVINGPNINFIGIREKNIYGDKDYEYLCSLIQEEAKKRNLSVDIVQSNSEGHIIDYIHGAYNKYQGIIINPGAYTHYSYAIYDALKSVMIPSVEVHISNIHARDEFRSKSVTAAASVGIISGFGLNSYVLALDAIKNVIE